MAAISTITIPQTIVIWLSRTVLIGTKSTGNTVLASTDLLARTGNTPLNSASLRAHHPTPEKIEPANLDEISLLVTRKRRLRCERR